MNVRFTDRLTENDRKKGLLSMKSYVGVQWGIGTFNQTLFPCFRVKRFGVFFFIVGGQVAVISTITSQLEGFGPEPINCLGLFCMEFVCSLFSVTDKKYAG